MLRLVEQVLEAAAVKRRQRQQDRQHPPAQRHRHSDNQGMPDQHQPRPIEERPPLLDRFRRKEGAFPFAVDDAETHQQHRFHTQDESARIDEGEAEIGAQRQLDRQHHLEIIRRVQGIAMMRLMAGPERDVIEPAQKTKDIAEDNVERRRLENGFVTELVKAVDQKGVERAVQIN